jgi:mono/diheme cytochrome c family protein
MKSTPSFLEASHDVRDARNRKHCTSYTVLVAVMAAAALLLCVLSSAALAQSGGQDYLKNCARCHGADGRGQHVVSPGVKAADLTLLSKENGGVFPFQDVEDAIDGRKVFPSHERLDMPFWGVDWQELGKEKTPESEARVKARIDAVVHYLESIQQK